MMSRAVKIAIADDHPTFRKCLKSILEREPDFIIIGEAEDGLEAIKIAYTLRPDVFLMDLNMPIMNGYKATEVITSKYPETKVIVLSMHSDDGVRVRALGAGACHFLCKGCNSAGISASIRSAVNPA